MDQAGSTSEQRQKGEAGSRGKQRGGGTPAFQAVVVMVTDPRGGGVQVAGIGCVSHAAGRGFSSRRGRVRAPSFPALRASTRSKSPARSGAVQAEQQGLVTR